MRRLSFSPRKTRKDAEVRMLILGLGQAWRASRPFRVFRGQSYAWIAAATSVAKVPVMPSMAVLVTTTALSFFTGSTNQLWP